MEFNDIVVREKDGHPVRVGDVARTEDGEAEPETTANVNGTGTVLLQVRRQSGTNTVEVVKEVERKVAEPDPGLVQRVWERAGVKPPLAAQPAR